MDAAAASARAAHACAGQFVESVRIIGKSFRVSRERGTFIHSPLGPMVMATIHPSAILRAPDDASRAHARAELVADLKKIARHLATHTRRASRVVTRIALVTPTAARTIARPRLESPWYRVGSR